MSERLVADSIRTLVVLISELLPFAEGNVEDLEETLAGLGPMDSARDKIADAVKRASSVVNRARAVLTTARGAGLLGLALLVDCCGPAVDEERDAGTVAEVALPCALRSPRWAPACGLDGGAR